MTICQNSGNFICNFVLFVTFKAIYYLLLHAAEMAIESISVDLLCCGYSIFKIDRNFFLTVQSFCFDATNSIQTVVVLNVIY